MARKTICDICETELVADNQFSDRPISGLTVVNTKNGQTFQKDFCRDCTAKVLKNLEDIKPKTDVLEGEIITKK